MKVRVGLGYDIHPLVKGRPLFLGGLKIESNLGLRGHSDADVLLHALSDALLGAMALGDIGMYFPDNENLIKNISSRVIIKKVLGFLKRKKFKILNIDAVLITRSIRIVLWRDRIIESLSKLLNIERKRISIKAKSNQGLGLFKEERAVACFVISLIGK